VKAGDRAERLSVRAEFHEAPSERFGVDRFADPFVLDVSVYAGGVERHVEAEGGAWRVPECRHGACELRYDYALSDAADHIDDVRFAARRGDTLLAPPSTFLLHPARAKPEAGYTFEVTTEPGWSFVSGVFKAGDDSYAADATYLPAAPYSGFGRFRIHRRRALDAELEVAIAPGELDVSEADLLDWIDRSAALVGRYAGRFPIPRALILILPRSGKRLFGMQMGSGGGAIYYDVGRRVARADLDDDWIATHEMLHLAQPTLPRKSRWFQEGFATYVEPVIRAQAGTISAERVWREFHRAMRQGQPEPGDQGLDRTPTWGRMYWGGAAFWLLADVEIRRRTAGRRSVRDAVVAILESGGNCSVSWDLYRTLEAADQGAGVPVFRELFERYGVRSEPFPLDRIFRDLGVVAEGGRGAFDASAKLAEIRRAITEPLEHGGSQH
jgi:hypothetical protein